MECECGKQQEVDDLKIENEELKRKNQHFNENFQKQRNENAKLESKMVDCLKEVKDLFDFKRKKLKSLTMKTRCFHCFMTFVKSDVETCADCKKNYHSFYCASKHNC